MSRLSKALAGPGYVILNVLRAINIITFLDLIAASVVMLIKISINNNFFFFEAVSHAFTTILGVFLVISELPFFDKFFTRFVPQLGETASFVPLSLVMLIMGVSVLGNLNNDDYSQDHMGMPFWRIVASAGILAMTMGIVNFIASFIFADSENSLTARHVRSYGAVADKVLDSKSSQRSFKLSPSGSFHNNNQADGLPTYRQVSITRSAEELRNSRFPVNISSPVREKTTTSPHATPYGETPEVTMPDLAHHPAMQGGNFV
ncbi:conserved hypothetical protein [Talaromyces stipitatus ATCC 10500]|uniref:DUF7598 domain-containing protein n=1 Tax=Talaromyces stipitatus (strain ATCC 10500 / CBS 375.48 / QM 6759 / NRRL 1006) TaxID=441959 RepID=B8LUD7_TALSN|nr:uncharacterized protein TSTA_071130 [Talaromyces stipitatus ATCC 10500]EED23710.1 conserved hypothetical protein [Talaromyces stipitatus ATCC 10500]